MTAQDNMLPETYFALISEFADNMLNDVDGLVKKATIAGNRSWSANSYLNDFRKGVDLAREFIDRQQRRKEQPKPIIFTLIYAIKQFYDVVFDNVMDREAWIKNPDAKNEWVKINGLTRRDWNNKNVISAVSDIVLYGYEILVRLNDYFVDTENHRWIRD
jgi:hypothetical protein